MLRRVLVVATLSLLSSTVLSPAWAERRVALVIGADDYTRARPLDNAVNDARSIEAALKKLGFEVTLETDRDLRRMRRALEDFRQEEADADVALVYFAGHGVEIDGENRLLPVDVVADSLQDIEESSLPLEEVRAAVADMAPIGLILLDACRNDPFATVTGSGRGAVALTPELVKAVKPGLGRVGKAENILFAFSAAPGETASDGDGSNSPFTSALTKYLGTEGLEIRSVLTLVQQEVYDRSNGKQLPYIENGLPQLFFAANDGAKLPERERLLLAMADITPAIRTEVEQVATDAGMPLAPLYSALISANASALTTDERAARLLEAADAFVKVREEMKTMASADPQVGRLRDEAETLLALGAFDTARERLEDAAALDRRSRQALNANFIERTLSEAATRYISGGAAKAELRYDLAIPDFEKTIALFREAGDDLAPEQADRRLQTLVELGDMYVTVGNITAAARTYETLRSHMERRLASGGSDLSISRDLAITHSKLGNTRATQGNLDLALENFEAARDILLEVSASDPDNTEWQSDLGVAHEEVGDTLVTRGEFEAAIQSYHQSLAIKERLAAAFPEDSGLQRDLSTVHDALGIVLRELGQTENSYRAFKTSLDIRQELVALTPGNRSRQRDLSVSLDKIGDVLRDKKQLPEALDAYRDGRAIVEALAATDPADTQLRRDIAVSSDKIGNVLADQKNFEGALASYREGLEIARMLAKNDPANSEWQRDHSVSLEKVGNMERRLGRVGNGLKRYEESLAIMRRLAESDPSNAGWQRDLSITLGEIGNMHVDRREAQAAGEALEEALAIRERLAASAPANARWQRDLVIALADFAQVAPDKRGKLMRALKIMKQLRDNGQMTPGDGMIDYLERRLARLRKS